MDTGKRTLAGGLIIVAGILLLMSNVGFFDFDIGRLFFSWPAILVFFGIIIMISSNFQSGFLLTSVGVIFLISKHYFLDLWTLWPAFLIIIGVNSLLHARRTPSEPDRFRHGHREGKNSKGDWDAHNNWKQEELHSDFICESAAFSGSRKFIHSSNFKGGKISAFFGGAEMDLSDCQLAPGNNVLDIDAVFGGITLFIPDEWRVIIQISPLFGDFSDERRKPSIHNINDDRTLIIRGRVIFGGGKIKSA